MTGDMAREPIAAWLDNQVELAARVMSQKLGEDSVCTVHKDGRVTGGLKYQEGRMSAMADVKRQLRQSYDLGLVLDEAVARWLAEFERRRESKQPSPIWVSYATGGLDAVREARALPKNRDDLGPS